VSTYSSRRPVRRKRIDPVTVIMALVPLVGIPVLGVVAYRVLTKPPETQQVIHVAAAKPVDKGPTEAELLAEAAKQKAKEDAEAAMDAPVGSGPVNSASGAVDQITEKLQEALAIPKKVLVVWLFDESASAANLREDVIKRLDRCYRTLNGKEKPPAKADDARVLSAVASFGEKVTFLTEEPVAAPNEVEQAASQVKGEKSHIENTFGAIKETAQKYLDYRTRKNRFVTIVVVSDEVGDDQTKVDEVVPMLATYSIPVYVIGQAAVFGVAEGGDRGAEGMSPGSHEIRVRQGPESRDPEWIRLSGPGDIALNVDTEMGPYSLSRLCLESGGVYYPLPSAGGYVPDSGNSGGRGRLDRKNDEGGYWGRASASGASKVTSSATSVGKPPSPFKKYAPEYLSEQAYQKQLQGNKAMRALVEAAKLPQAEIVTSYDMAFRNDDEIKRNKDLDAAQRPAVRVLPGITALYDLLKPGEADEPKLPEGRWKVGFDLALGRVMAAKARTDGYNNMLAVMKAGKKFKDPKSTQWIIEPTDEATGVSAVDNMAAKARKYLKSVVDTYPGTPWADSAERELQVPIGWKWTER
jgi:hypothetical protein